MKVLVCDPISKIGIEHLKNQNNVETIILERTHSEDELLQIINDISDGILEKSKIIKLPNRKLAIKKSIKISKKDDIVIIAGKGNEDTINYGS